MSANVSGQGNRTVKGLLLEIKNSDNYEMRCLAEETLVNMFEDNLVRIRNLEQIKKGVLIGAMQFTIDNLQSENAKLKEEVNKFKDFTRHFSLDRKKLEYEADLALKKQTGCICPVKKIDGRPFDGVSYYCPLHGR